jgi:hypothetical protein
LFCDFTVRTVNGHRRVVLSKMKMSAARNSWAPFRPSAAPQSTA